MAGRGVIHETFRIERTYAAAPSAVFAAFSTEEARNGWGDTGDLEPPEDQDDDDSDSEVSEFDFRIGRRESFSTKEQGTTYRYDGRYYDMPAPSARPREGRTAWRLHPIGAGVEVKLRLLDALDWLRASGLCSCGRGGPKGHAFSRCLTRADGGIRSSSG